MTRRPSPATWHDAVRALNALDPVFFNVGALGRIFKKNEGTIWWIIHKELRQEFERARYIKRTAKSVCPNQELQKDRTT